MRRGWWVCVVAGLIAASARAQEPAPAAVEAIPIPQVASRAEATLVRLRTLEAGAQPRPNVVEIERQLPALESSADRSVEETYRVLKQGTTLAALDDVLEGWMNVEQEASRWVETLTQRAEELDTVLGRLEEVRAQWMATQAATSPAEAPVATVDRIKDTLAVIDSTTAAVRERRASVLVLQDRSAQVLARADEMLEQIQAARRALLGRVFDRDGIPIWGFFSRSATWAETRNEAARAIVVELPVVQLFTRQHQTVLLLQLALFLGLGLVLRHMGRHARRWTAIDDDLAVRLRALEHPWASAALMTVLFAAQFPPSEPRVVQAGVALLAVIPIIRLLATLSPPWLRPAVWTAGAFHVVDLVRSVLAAVPLLEQGIFQAQSVALVAAIAWLAPTLPERWRRVGHVALALAGVALGAAFLGYARLARLVEFGLIASWMWALVLTALVRIADAIVAWALRVRPLRLLRAVQENRTGLERRLHGFNRLGAIAFWTMGAAGAFSILGPLGESLGNVLGARLSYGAVNVSLGDLLAFALVVWLTFLLSVAIRALLEEDVFSRVSLGRGLAVALSSLAHYAVLLVGFLIALAALGVDFTRITIVAGALGVGIGFGLQNVVNNFVSGLILLFERPIQVGDTVQLGTLTGDVKRIGIRSSTVRTFDGAEVIVPNASLVSDQVTNWTLSDRMRRIDLDVGVAYGTDPRQVVELLGSVARANPGVLPDPTPVVLFLGFGDSALNFQLRAWTARYEEWLTIRSELGIGVAGALRDAGITIPFPQRDVRIVEVDTPTRSSQA